MFETMPTKCSYICSYIQKNTLNLIEYIPQNTLATPNYIFGFHILKHPYLSEISHSTKSAFYADDYGTINISHILKVIIYFYMLRATQPISLVGYFLY